MIFLNAKQSTYSGYVKLQHTAFNKLKENHPKLKDLTFDQWQAMVVYMGMWQSAHEGEQYDSETLLSNSKWAYETGQWGPFEFKKVDIDKWFLDVQREGSSGQWLDLKRILKTFKTRCKQWQNEKEKICILQKVLCFDIETTHEHIAEDCDIIYTWHWSVMDSDYNYNTCSSWSNLYDYFHSQYQTFATQGENPLNHICTQLII